MSSPEPGPVQQRAPHIGSHRDLLSRLLAEGQRRPGTLQAVIVPAARPAGNLALAAKVARLADATLVVFANRLTEPQEAVEVALRQLPPSRVVVVPVEREQRLPGFSFAADQVASEQEHRDVDTSVKRNAGLALAVMAGWSHVLFLDDDVRGFGRHQLAVVESAFSRSGGRWKAVGWAFDNFPDNSVVCHAYRAVGGEQSTFVGAGALAVAVSRRVPHFPRIYNEDWLFLWPFIRSRGVALAGTLKQLPYEPFADPARASRQEFGDTMAEGLFRHAHLRQARHAPTTENYWRDFLNVRLRFLHHLRDEVLRVEPRQALEIMACLQQAEQARKPEWAGELADYLSRWHADSLGWKRRLATLPVGVTVDRALAELGLQRMPGSARLPLRQIIRPRLPAGLGRRLGTPAGAVAGPRLSWPARPGQLRAVIQSSNLATGAVRE